MNKTDNQELIIGMLHELQSHEKKQGMENLVKAADYLHSAIEIFEEAGMTEQADKILKILAKIASDSNGAKHKEHRLSEKELMKWIKDPKSDEREEVSYKSIAKEPNANGDDLVFKSILDESKSDDNDAKKKKQLSDPHTKGLTSEKMLQNFKENGSWFNMVDDNTAEDLLNLDINDADLEVNEGEAHEDSLFEEE